MDKYNAVYSYTLDYYLVIKKNEVHATTQMNLENMLGERNQSQKNIHCMILFI